jgi:hypothetical protein
MCGGLTGLVRRRGGSEFSNTKVLNIHARVLHLYEEERF